MKQILLIIAALTLSLPSFSQISGGPDGFGYTWLSTLSPAPNAPTYNWIDISTIGTPVVGLGDDNSIGPVSMGISFHYYWSSYHSMYIGSNGYIGFNPGTIASSGTLAFPNIPTMGGTDNFVAPLLSDLSFAGTGNPGQVYVWSNFSDTCIVSYVNVPFWINNAAGYGGSNTFQVIFAATDSSITFQYQGQTGTWDVASYGGATNPDVIGIENVTGAIGLQVSNNNLPNPGFAVKFFYPGTITLSVPDVTPAWAANPESGGFFWPSNGSAVFGDALISNVGNVNVTTATNVQLQIRNAANNQLLHSDNDSVSMINQGLSDTVTFPLGYTPTSPGNLIYRVNTMNTVDINPSNNQVDVEMVVVDTTANTIELTYWGGTPGSAANNIMWSGGNQDDGLGMYFEPPVYPAEINLMAFYVFTTGTGITGSTAFEVKIFDDDAPAGQGTLIGTGSVSAANVQTGAWNPIVFPTPILIPNGGFYVGWYMTGVNISLGTELNPPFSNRGFEVLGNAWAPFRFSNAQELMIRVGVSKSCAGSAAVNLGADQSICAGQSVTLDAGSGFSGFSWSTGASSQMISVNAAGSYSVSAMDANGCPSNDTLNVSLLPAPSVNLGPDLVQCAGPPVLLDAGSGFANYSWSNGATSQTISVTNTGNFWVTVTDAGNGCTGGDTVNITINPNPVVSLGPDMNICQGGSVLLSAGPGFSSYVWSTGDMLPTLQVSGPGQYWVTVTDISGCSNSDTINVTLNTVSVDIGADQQFCEGLSATLDAGSGFAAYIWSNGNSGQMLTVSTSGSYSVTVIDAQGCQGMDTVLVTVDPIPVAGFSFSSSGGGGFNFANTSSDGTGFSWDFGDGQGSPFENPMHQYAASGMYTVTLIVSNACGMDTLSQTIAATVSIDPDLFADEVKVYPVPANDRLIISFEGLRLSGVEISIVDLQGRVVSRELIGNITAETLHESDVSGLSPGVYFLYIRTEKHLLSRKLMIQRE